MADAVIGVVANPLSGRDIRPGDLKYKRLDGVDACLRTLLPTLLTSDDTPAIDGPSLLADVTDPVAVVWGAADRILPPPSGSAPGAVFRMVPMEKPGDVPGGDRRGSDRRPIFHTGSVGKIWLPYRP